MNAALPDLVTSSSKLSGVSSRAAEADDDHNELLKQLQAQFKESQDALEKLKGDSAPVIKLLKAASPAPAKVGGKDEV
jgi:hypothetical protein